MDNLTFAVSFFSLFRRRAEGCVTALITREKNETAHWRENGRQTINDGRTAFSLFRRRAEGWVTALITREKNETAHYGWRQNGQRTKTMDGRWDSFFRGGISFWFLVRLCPFLRCGLVLGDALGRERKGGLRIARGFRRRGGLLVLSV